MISEESVAKQGHCGRDHAPDFQDLAVLGANVWVSGVGRNQAHLAIAMEKTLASELVVHDRDDQAVVVRLQGTVNGHDVIVADAGIDHRVSPHTHEVRGLRMCAQQIHEIATLHHVIICRRGKARWHAKVQQVDGRLKGAGHHWTGKIKEVGLHFKILDLYTV